MDCLKTYYLSLYKKRVAVDIAGSRVAKMNENRKINRHDALLEKRKIPENMTPIVTPASKRPKLIKTQQTEEKPSNKRLEMLVKWKAEKQLRKAQAKQNAKPVFKVSAVSASVGLPNLENVNKEIKGKPFKSKFAPANHKFKPPANIKPIQLGTGNSREEVVEHHMVTRSRANNLQPQNDEKVDVKTLRNLKGNNKKETKQSASVEVTVNKTKKAHTLTRKNAIPKKKESKQPTLVQQKVQKSAFVAADDDQMRTPQTTPEKKTEAPPYISPFVTISRGKNSARKEFEARGANQTFSGSATVTTPEKKTEAPPYISPFVTISRGKNSARKEFEARRANQTFSGSATVTTKHTTPKAGAAFFDWTLDTNIQRLRELSDKWTRYKDEENPPEEAISMIDVAIGQTNLLITQKFNQFRGLIRKCQNGIDEAVPVTCEDLHGFWDMVHIQVVNLDKRFDNLDKLKAQNWLEVIPEVKKEVVKKKSKTLRNAKASRGLREAILAARKKKLDADHESKDITPDVRRSNRLSIVKSTNRTNRPSSPGLVTLKVAQYAKSVETPNKSILKTDIGTSGKKHCKVVLFQDEIGTIENCMNNMNLQTTDKTPKRSSVRLLERKLL